MIFYQKKKDLKINFNKINIYNLNLLEPNKTNELEDDYTHIIHLAAILGVQDVINNPFNVMTSNVQMTINALKTGTKKLKTIFSSSSEVYAGTLQFGRLNIPTPEKSD